MTKLIGEPEIEALTLGMMRDQKAGNAEWFTYQNHDLGSSQVGHLQFLQCGPNCTYKEAPKKMPDSHLGIGWRYLLVGKVDLDSGGIVPLESTQVNGSPSDDRRKDPRK